MGMGCGRRGGVLHTHVHTNGLMVATCWLPGDTLLACSYTVLLLANFLVSISASNLRNIGICTPSLLLLFISADLSYYPCLQVSIKKLRGPLEANHFSTSEYDNSVQLIPPYRIHAMPNICRLPFDIRAPRRVENDVLKAFSVVFVLVFSFFECVFCHGDS
ncbi:hypothetical protein BU24DRAFT_92511 [Aaosphaeria arxii CBS 175.79]|uniref:Uncharacterized protein n=1 Tax=Aaosphaeria arxii CBS 175.79 TaxID=1450172 RepID=A0A6A5X7F0_9PLEO|nr:uncharacterized protein BU24DRAFT_92511 [Aaosphaeria arxii CBS 175.79]KAF2008849.1 hypothetical protein BU24DRAFT_92511 [Aaosphaeria arxii CBS 175.79]